MAIEKITVSDIQNLVTNGETAARLINDLKLKHNQLVDAINSGEIVAGVDPLVQPTQFGDGVTTTFSSPAEMEYSPYVFMVFLGGFKQIPVDAYTVDTSGNIVFSEAPAEGVEIEITLFSPVLNDSVGSTLVTAEGYTLPRKLGDWVSKGTLTYNTVAEAVADVLLEVGQSVRTLGYHSANGGGGANYIVRDSSYTLLAGDHLLTNGNKLELEIEAVNDVRKWGAVGISGNAKEDIPAVDESSYIQAAFDRIRENKGGTLSGVHGRVYGVGSPVVFNAANSNLTGLNLVAIGDSWTASQTVLTFGVSFVGSAKRENSNSSNNFVNANHKAGGAIHYMGVQKSSVINNTGIRALTYQQRIGDSAIGDSASCTDTDFISLTGYEWSWNEGPATSDYSLRTSKGLFIDGADSNIIGGTFSGCKYCLDLGQFYNCQLTGVTFFAGGVRDSAGVVTARVGPLARRAQFSNCRIDDGALEIRNFSTTFSNCKQIQYTAFSNIILVATNPDEDASGLTFLGHQTDTMSDVVLQTEGGGSFSDNLNVDFRFIRKSDGSEAAISSVKGTLSKDFKLRDRRLYRGDQGSLLSNVSPAFSANSTDGRVSFHSISTSGSNYGAPAVRGAKARSADLTARPADNDTLMEMVGTGSNGTRFNNDAGGAVRILASENWSATNHGTDIQLYTTANGSTTASATYNFSTSGFNPLSDDVRVLGSASLRWKEIFSANGTINTSDRRDKTQVEDIPDKVLDAWSDVGKKQFKWIGSVNEKGDSARWHIGVMAQDIQEAFKKHGLDAFEYGVLCFDEWEEKIINHEPEYGVEEDANGEIVQVPALDEDGSPLTKPMLLEDGSYTDVPVMTDKLIVKKEAWTEIKPAGSKFGVRYDQAAQLDAALARRDLMEIKSKIDLLMSGAK